MQLLRNMPKMHILIVDDEDLIRDLLIDALQDDFQITAASNGEEALSLFRLKIDTIGLVITDLIMPKLRGDELAKLIREMNPSIPIVYISGYEREINKQSLLSDKKSAFLQKPFDMEILSATLRQLLTQQ